MKKLLTWCGFLVCVLVLSSCFIPEKFSSEFNFKEDGAFNYKFDGTITHALIAAEKTKAGGVSEKTQKSIPAIVQQIQKSPDTKEAKHLDDAKFKVVIQGERNIKSIFSLLDFLKVVQDKNGVIRVFSPPLNEKNKKEIKELGINIDGTLKITLPKNAEVLESNATSSPSLGGLIGGYTWKINSDNPVNLKFKLKDK